MTQPEQMKKFIATLDGLIAAILQASALGGISPKERDAMESMKDARLNFIEELEGDHDHDYLQLPYIEYSSFAGE